jgi:hypothetical protein
VLDAERDLFARESELVRSQTTVTTNAIALYKALGGGWEPFEPTAPASQDTATLVDAIPVLGTVRELGRQMRRTRAE